MTVLVTGATGFTGRALVRHLTGLRIPGITALARSIPPGSNTLFGARVVRCDLRDRSRTRTVINEIRPEYLVHLAGLTRGTKEELFPANVAGTENLLDAVRAARPDCRVLVISSSAVYGDAGRSPVGEDTPITPLGAYGESKAVQERAVLAHRAETGAQVAIARPFNLIGPGQPDTFLCGRIVKQAVEIERGQRKSLALMETRSYRDFIDVRDAVRAYWALVAHPDFARMCAGTAFNIGSGTARAVSDVISLVEEITGRTYVVDLPEDPPIVPIPFQQADIARIKRATGWTPAIPLKESLADMIVAERERRAGKNL